MPTGTKLFSETSSTVVLTRLPHVDDTYNQRFNNAAPVQLFNQTDRSANYVVIVTTVSRCAICVCVSGLCQSLSLTLNRLCILFCSHGMPLFFFFVVGFFFLPGSPSLVIWMPLGCWTCVVFHILICEKKQSVYVCEYASYFSFSFFPLNVCMFSSQAEHSGFLRWQLRQMHKI